MTTAPPDPAPRRALVRAAGRATAAVHRGERDDDVTTSPELFELKVLVEALDWHDVAALMASVDRALDPHQRAMSGARRWSVVANRLPAERAGELLNLVEGRALGDPPHARHADAEPARRSA